MLQTEKPDIEEVMEIALGGTVTIQAGRMYSEDGSDVPEPACISLHSNGDIFINGRLAENDKEVVNGMRQIIDEFILCAQKV